MEPDTSRRRGWPLALGGLLSLLSPPTERFAVPPATSADTAALTARGQGLLSQYQCGSCHLIPGVAGAEGRLAPALGGFGRRSYIAGELPNTPDRLQRWIVDPRSLLPATPMPSMGVTAADARAMAAYLVSLR